MSGVMGGGGKAAAPGAGRTRGQLVAPDTLLAVWEGRSAGEWAQRLSVETVEFHATVPSTNGRAKVLVEEGRPVPAVVVAERQSAGRGRRGRRWVSDTPLGLWFTLVWEVGEGDLGGLPLRVGLGVAEGVESVVPGLRVDVKWPNDLIVAGKKVGGVLCERCGEHVLVGVGLNLNHGRSGFPAPLRATATSVRLTSGRPVARADVLARVVEALARIRASLLPEIPAAELAALEARSSLAGCSLWIDGIVRHSSEHPRTVERLPVTAGTILADGSLEVHDDAGRRLRLISGTVRPVTATSGASP